MWEYGESSRVATIESVGSDDCIFCGKPLGRMPAHSFESGSKRLFVQVSVCLLCGWWTVYRVHQGEHARTASLAEGYSGSIGCLKELDLDDVSAPLGEVRQYLLAKKDSAFDAHPKLLEDVVCSMFKDLGWSARVTAYSGDEGIDVILDGPKGSTIGVQVKRYKRERRIEAEQIRSLAGALLGGGHTKGIFITTSTFRRGARKAADKMASAGYPIELVDAERFLEALGVAQVKSFKLTPEQIHSYILKSGIHIGTGVHKDFVEGEDLRARPVVIMAWTRDDLLELHGDES
jgi:restriction system protein